MDTLTIINIVVFSVVLIWIIYEIIQYFRRKNTGVDLSAEEFNRNMRKAQIIDLREREDFQAGHILGARNIPYLQFKQRMNELRKDQPVYLYDQKETLSRRASLLLKKAGYTEIYRLKNGYEEWDGRIKRSK